MPLSVKALHRQAMERADELELLTRRHGSPLRIRRVATIAFWLERCAALQLEQRPEHEPSRSVLYRSAAWLAVRAERYADAIQCAEAGLAGVIHGDLRAELEEVLDEARRLQSGEGV